MFSILLSLYTFYHGINDTLKYCPTLPTSNLLTFAHTHKLACDKIGANNIGMTSVLLVSIHLTMIQNTRK